MGNAGHCTCGWAVCVACATLICKAAKKKFGKKVLAVIGAAAFVGAILAIIPVSYTHLDVYKRQDRGTAEYHGRDASGNTGKGREADVLSGEGRTIAAIKMCIRDRGYNVL